MENTETTIISTDINGLALAIQDGFEKMIQEEEWVCVRGVRFYITKKSIGSGGLQANYDFFDAELRKMVLPNITMYMLKYNWYADLYWQGGVADFEIFELSNPCDYEEILSVTKKHFEERCADKLLDLDSIYIDRNSIEDILRDSIAARVTQDDLQEPVLVFCGDCKYGHIKCANPDGLFYRTPCKIVKWCEQGETC